MSKTRRKQRAKSRDRLDKPVGPGVVAVIEHFAEASLGTSRRYVNVGESPLALAYVRGKLHGCCDGRDADQVARSRLLAGESFRVVFEASMAPGETRFERAITASGPRTTLPDNQIDAGRHLARIRDRIGPDNFTIIEAFCGHRYSMIEALRLANVPFAPQGVAPRVLEALDRLATVVAPQG